MQALKDNLDLLLKKLPKLMPHHEGKYALVCRGTVSVYDTADDATEAAKHICKDPSEFLVIKIESPASSSWR